ncbi:putative vacuolar protein sorting-associated protein [Scheffersomyces coipomensis]|uniref:putative vacuolar protein sorting-associated protein n=1 Tax=Scheffersomyces coipomensis TaxID=1788519 RepID=UPI00315CC75C
MSEESNDQLEKEEDVESAIIDSLVEKAPQLILESSNDNKIETTYKDTITSTTNGDASNDIKDIVDEAVDIKENVHNEEDDDQDDEDEDEDEDDEDPPILKYTRLNQLPSNFFSKDPVSASNFHDSYFIFATHSGVIHICNPDFTPVRTFKAHRASVLSIYTDGIYFATGSMDGTVVIGSIKDEKDIIAYDFQRPIHGVVLDRNYYKTRSFISGGMSGKVIYSSKGWIGKRADVILEEDNGPIVGIQLIDDIVIWMNDKGITVFHLTARQIISLIEKPEDSHRSDLFWPRVTYPEVDRVIIAWGNYIWSLRVSLKTAGDKDGSTPSSSTMGKILPSTASISFRAIQEKKVEIEHIFKLDFLISGISTFKDDLWMVLTYFPATIAENEKRIFHNPEIKLINSSTGEIEFEEELGLKNINNLGLNDYTLGHHIETNPKYYIISAKDAVIAEELQLSDRLNWYLERENYYEAWNISEHLVSAIKRLNYGVQYVDNLIQNNEWDNAAIFLQQLLYIDLDKLPDSDARSTTITARSNSSQEERDQYIKEIVSQWQTWASIFINSNHIKELTSIIPTSARLSLSAKVFNDILSHWLTTDVDIFNKLLNDWDIEIYDHNLIETNIETVLSETSLNDNVIVSNDKLRRCLTNLYTKSYQPIKAVPHLIKLNDENIIKYLSDNHILNTFLNDLPVIIKLRFKGNEHQKDINRIPITQLESRLSDIVDVLVENRHEILPKTIIDLFNKNHLNFMNYFYLEKLNLTDDFLVQSFGNERIELYAQYNRSLMLPFLIKSSHSSDGSTNESNSNYDIFKTIELCERNEFIEELVYLLGEIGENKRALMLIIDKLDDPVKAIEFTKRQNDKELWNLLLDNSMSRSNFVKSLIENSDDNTNLYYDPITILKRMSSDINIKGLNKSIIKYSNNNDLNLLLNQLILKLFYRQAENSSLEFRSQSLKGWEVDINDLQTLINQFETILVLKNSTSIDYKLMSDYINNDHNNNLFNDLGKKLSHLQELKLELNDSKPINSG